MMQKNSEARLEINFKTKLSLVIFGLFLSLVLLEVGLRLGGFVLLSLQEYRNRQTIRQKGAYRIMCLGESTTAGQYPAFLEEILNRHSIGIRFSVIDKGVGGSTTSDILGQLDKNLNTYHPDIVVTMMGINDWREHIPYEVITTSKIMLFFKSFRTYKLTRLLWLHILTKAKEVGLYTLDHKSISSEDALKKAIALNPKNYGAYLTLGWWYRNQGKFSQAEEAFKKAIAVDSKDERAYLAILVLYEETGKPELAKEYSQKTNTVRLGNYQPATVNNFIRLKEILDKRGIRLVCVQYPMRSIGPLKRIFKGNENGIIFVDNERIFRDVVQQGGYRAYFRDIFAGDFGHCTEKGNRLLAENIASISLREAFGK